MQQASDPAATGPGPSGPGRDPARGPDALGLYVRAAPPRAGARPLVWVAAAAGLGWALLVLWLARAGGGGGDPVLTLLAAVLPVVLAGGVALVLVRLADLGAETDRLRASVDAMRQAYLAQVQAQGSGARSAVEAKLDEIARVSRKTQTTLAMFTSIRQGRRRWPCSPRSARPPNRRARHPPRPRPRASSRAWPWSRLRRPRRRPCR
ncbi:MAG: hypothetical protein MUF73_09785 [Rhodobacteraceae bacterium]|nr:hypothetical protein [Paracoccaceae bacterium]